ncbi:MAG: hypothetical protein ACTSX4_05705 [Candidatus Helarchaeota archaeon]
MIITEKKPFDEVKKNIDKYDNIFVVSCGDCCAVCKTGGTEGAKEIIEKIKTECGKEVPEAIVIEAPCDERVAKRDLKRVKEEVDKSDAILVLTCGLGAQSINELTGKVVIPALNTKYMGIIAGFGTAKAVCFGCDSCVLIENDGNCPYNHKLKCKKCGRINAADAKMCDQCGNTDFEKLDILTHKIM